MYVDENLLSLDVQTQLVSFLQHFESTGLKPQETLSTYKYGFVPSTHNVFLPLSMGYTLLVYNLKAFTLIQ